MKTKPKTFSPWFYTTVVLLILGMIIFCIWFLGYLFNEMEMIGRAIEYGKS